VRDAVAGEGRAATGAFAHRVHRVFDGATCTAPVERAARMRDVVLEYAPRERPITILDVGCGASTLLFQLADALPLARCVGVDISSANVQAAERTRQAHPAGDRIRLICADYLECAIEPVDVIVTDTALHFIDGDPAQLWAKLSRDVRPAGVLVCAMAYAGPYNRGIRAVRRTLRRLQFRPVTAMVDAAARMAHGRTFGADGLSERTAYMYIPPTQWMTPAIRNGLAPSLGLDLVSEREVPAASRTQLLQRITVFVKRQTNR
jgi:ubiquinone/menaquinone biosynthesis C-methylase UbiE